MNVCCYNHDLKFIVVYGKNSKALIYYNTNYIICVFIKKMKFKKLKKHIIKQFKRPSREKSLFNHMFIKYNWFSTRTSII